MPSNKRNIDSKLPELQREVSHAVDLAKERVGTRVGAKTRKSARTRARILESATDLIRERGGLDFQMSEIAERCNMSKGALYYYFRDRDAILGEILDRSMDEFVERLESAVGEADTPVQALRHICSAFAQCASEGGTVLIAISRDVGVLPRIENRLDRLSDLIERQLVRAQEEGSVRREVDPRLIAYCLCGSCFFAATERVKEGGEIDPVRLAGELADFAMRGIRVAGAV